MNGQKSVFLHFEGDIFVLFTVSNLKKIIETVTEYYIDVLNITLTEFISPNVMKIGEKNDKCELGRFLQLVLGNFSAYFKNGQNFIFTNLKKKKIFSKIMIIIIIFE